MIIETSDGRLYEVRETGNPKLAHAWYGIEVKRLKGVWIAKSRTRLQLVRKAATRVVEA